MAAGLQAHFDATYMSTTWQEVPKLSDYMVRLPADTGILLLQWMELTRGAMRMLSDDADIDLALEIVARRERRHAARQFEPEIPRD
jgi:hypothetical protein